jgi:hypothetical protein
MVLYISRLEVNVVLRVPFLNEIFLAILSISHNSNLRVPSMLSVCLHIVAALQCFLLSSDSKFLSGVNACNLLSSNMKFG